MKLLQWCTALTAATFLTLTQIAHALEPMQVTLFLHQDVTEGQSQVLYKHHLLPLETELKELSDRPVYFNIVRNHPTISSFEYEGDDLRDTMQRLQPLIDQYRSQNPTITHPSLNKYLLITSAKMNATTGGMTYDKAYWGVAGLTTYTSIGHELGHMMGATHENGEVLHNGWYCETYVHPDRNPLRSNCYRYSDANREVVRAYLENAS